MTYMQPFPSYPPPIKRTQYTMIEKEKARRLLERFERIEHGGAKTVNHIPSHTTLDNDTVLIPAMTDEHLLNCIAFFCHPLAQATEAIEKLNPETISKRAAAAYGGNNVERLTEQYPKIVGTAYAKLGPYMVEASIRGLEEAQRIVQCAFGRTTRDTEAPCPSAYLAKQGRYEKASLRQQLIANREIIEETSNDA